MTPPNPTTIGVISDVIRNRRTTKLRVDPERALPVPEPSLRDVIEDLIALGSKAPHHFPCDPSHQTAPLDSPVPWRFYCLAGDACRRLMDYMRTLDGRVEKAAAMLAAADGLIIVTWLPDPPSEPLAPDIVFEATRRNMEHVAGAAAAVQNILLGATAQGIRTYWASGAALRRPDVLHRLGVPNGQELLGAVFLFPEPSGRGEVKHGARRGTEGRPESWMCWVDG